MKFGLKEELIIVNYENINNSNLDGMSLASFCQSRAALFNNVFTFKNLSCMGLHAISVFDKV